MTVDERFSDDYLAKRQDTALLGKRNPIVTGPVSDWATDFSHLEPEWATDPYPILEELRDRCPIAHTDRFGCGRRRSSRSGGCRCGRAPRPSRRWLMTLGTSPRVRSS